MLDGLTFTGDILNHRRIEAGNDGIRLDTRIDFTGDIVNRGTIDAGDNGIDINGVSTSQIDFDTLVIPADLTFAGNVLNDRTIEAGNDGIIFGSDGRFDGVNLLDADGTIALTGEDRKSVV